MPFYSMPYKTFAMKSKSEIKRILEQHGFNYAKEITTESAGDRILFNQEDESQEPVSKDNIKARKHFSIEDRDSGETITVKKGDTGELLAKRAGKPYIIIINDKTMKIQDRKMLRYLFKNI